jgi:hypothetical protein
MPKKSANAIISFKAKLENPQPQMDAAFITFPFDVKELFGTKGMVKVKASFDGHPYRGILSNMGGAHHVILVRKDVRAAIGKNVGDTVNVTIAQDTEERTVNVPEDLQQLFERNKKAAAFFKTLSYTNRKEYVLWITNARKEETRQNRLRETISKLTERKKNPTDKG